MIELGRFRPARRDPHALGFGVAFLLLGGAGVLRDSGLDLDASTLSQLALIALGVGGLVSAFVGRRRARG